tara:strand:- start:150 stop:350 length:201 start_codon:yes stop_codon:yes gene_type:complete
MVTQKLKIKSGALCRFKFESPWRYILVLNDYNHEAEDVISVFTSGKKIDELIIKSLIELGYFEVIQ